ncbi:MAG: Putative zinc metalloprotease Rip3 [Candidatus Moanabacter tarae]|uniref:Zinc metalloprotease n=1 Tax=Candidatus Moanibacter tarae TaxID=2200854 RepID=A0A2Z4AHB7_9BACT|nr:MAG: Putative zinc metalloprotease Rip3 [Candidatus Moanabacter tarae]|tara:strand:+ start:8336 stop:9424 length:1089 start_codon:yes stop_codon:yes gene_type:complete
MLRSWSFQLFRIYGIQIELHFTFLILLAWVAWDGWIEAGILGGAWSLTLIILLFICVVFHELGHCLVARHYRIKIHRILLLPIGGMAQFGEIPRNPIKELLITVAGPAVNFGFFGLVYACMGWPEKEFLLSFSYDLNGLFVVLLFFNLTMGIFNLFPVFPMDGGRILRAILALRFSYLTATKIALWIAKPLAVLGVILALTTLESILTAILFAFIFIGGELEYAMVRRRETLGGLTIADVTCRDFIVMDANITVQDAVSRFSIGYPRSIILLDDGMVAALLSPSRLKKIVKKAKAHDLLISKTDSKITALQADWPLEVFVDSIFRNIKCVYPVYQHNTIIGIVEPSNIQGIAEWKNLSRRFI